MNDSLAKLHILLDSREPSVSFARNFYRSGGYLLGEVEHIRGITFAERFKILLERCAIQDEILISVHYLSEEQLGPALLLLQSKKYENLKISLATYGCFTHLRKWCFDTGCQFLPNPYKKRIHPKNIYGDKTAQNESEHLERIWVQYRLILAIISRSEMLGDVCRQLISGDALDEQTIDHEYERALRYFELGEPDMAGGSYFCEGETVANCIDELRYRINKIAATDFNVLIKGESGSGKETAAWAIHELSSRRDKPFLVINCAGLPDELLESEMFGYRKGSHNQAYHDAPGLLDTADGGTLFLDELPDMSPRIQAKLLRFIETGEYRPLGGSVNRYSDTRIIAAGQPARFDAVDGLRSDLKNRIGQLDIDIVPLRQLERACPGTLYKIAFILLERYTWTTIYHANKPRQLTPGDIKKFQDELALPHNLQLLTSQEWKESNIRELNNFLRKWTVFGDGEFKVLARESPAQNTALEGHWLSSVPDDELKKLLVLPKNRRELKDLFARKPLQNIKKAYIRYIFEVYSRIVEQENVTSDMVHKPTQKELAMLMGVTENTISRHLN